MSNYYSTKSYPFGLKTTTFIGAEVWNFLLDEFPPTTILKEFSNAVRELHYFVVFYGSL